MPSTLSTAAIERSTYAIVIAFTDDASASVVPTAGSLTWSLYKRVGDPAVDTIVNSREDVAITSAASVTIVLSGADLALVAGESGKRYVVVEGTYTSSLGAGLPIKDQVGFSIVNLVGIV